MNTKLSFFTPILLLSICVLSFTSCDQDSERNTVEEEISFTGESVEYTLLQGSDFKISGTALIRERIDKSVQIDISLTGTEGEIYHPTHLHFGLVNDPDADIAALLNPVYGIDGMSSTIITTLSDESTVTFESFKSMEGSIKVHLSDTGEDSKVVIAGNNIGAVADSNNTSGRVLNITTCKTN